MKQSREQFLARKVKTVGEGDRIFCRACRRLIRPGEQYEEKETPKPFRRMTDWVTTHYPNCLQKK